MLKLKLLPSAPTCQCKSAFMLRVTNGLLFALSVIIYTRESTPLLVEAYIVEAFKASAGNGCDAMVRDQEIFLPSHEDMFSLGKVLVAKI